eukprot:3592206-Alexandrium_andersonii.AAC.1
MQVSRRREAAFSAHCTIAVEPARAVRAARAPPLRSWVRAQVRRRPARCRAASDGSAPCATEWQ